MGVGFGVGVGNGNFCGADGVERFVWRKLSGCMLWRLGSAFTIMVPVLVVEAVGGTDFGDKYGSRSLSGVWSRFFFGLVDFGYGRVGRVRPQGGAEAGEVLPGVKQRSGVGEPATVEGFRRRSGGAMTRRRRRGIGTSTATERTAWERGGGRELPPVDGLGVLPGGAVSSGIGQVRAVQPRLDESQVQLDRRGVSRREGWRRGGTNCMAATWCQPVSVRRPSPVMYADAHDGEESRPRGTRPDGPHAARRKRIYTARDVCGGRVACRHRRPTSTGRHRVQDC